MTGGLVRKEAVDTVHPLVRVHPVTGEKCLFFNGEFISKIEGLKDTEQRWLLDFLMNHVVSGHDFQARVRWQPKTIVIFDNRSTLRMFPYSLCYKQKRSNMSQTRLSSTILTTTTELSYGISSAWLRWLRSPFPPTTSSNKRMYSTTKPEKTKVSLFA